MHEHAFEGYFSPHKNMPNAFPQSVISYWKNALSGEDIYRDADLSVVVNPDLEDGEGVTIFYNAHDRHTTVALLPALATSFRDMGVPGNASVLTEEGLRQTLADMGIVMHGADKLYYLPESDRDAWLMGLNPARNRQLEAGDADLFATFTNLVSETDLEAAQIDLDDWAVFGAFDLNGQLVCTASLYPWGDSPVADVGILTLPSARGMGIAKHLLRVVGHHAMANGYELQYRSQLDNLPSIALASAAGLGLFGHWEIPSPEDQAR